MKDQINTIREALSFATPNHQALAALTQLEAMVGEQEPVARLHVTETDTYPDIEVEVLDGTHLQPGMSPIPVYVAAPVAQQPQARPDFADEWTGYLKDGETPFERFLRERKDVQSVLKLYQRALEENESLKAQQPQAEAVRWGVDWGTHGDRTCVSIIKKHADGKMEVVATEYEPERKAAPQQAEAVPPGYVLVPVEPTEAMRDAAVQAICYGPEGGFTRISGPQRTWKAMIDAAIAQQKGQP